MKTKTLDQLTKAELITKILDERKADFQDFNKAEADKYSELDAAELLSCWALTQTYLKTLHDDDELCLDHIKERFAEHVSLQRRLECRIELLQSREEAKCSQ